MLNLELITLTTTLVTTVSYLLCVAFGLVAPESMHMHQLLQILLPGFVWLSVGAFFLGLLESVLGGIYLGGGFTLIYNALYRRMGNKEAA